MPRKSPYPIVLSTAEESELESIAAVACELPCERGIPLSRFSTREIATEVIRKGIVAEISGSTIWRRLKR